MCSAEAACDKIYYMERKRVNLKVYVISRLERVNRQNKILNLNCLEETSVGSKKAKSPILV